MQTSSVFNWPSLSDSCALDMASREPPSPSLSLSLWVTRILANKFIKLVCSRFCYWFTLLVPLHSRTQNELQQTAEQVECLFVQDTIQRSNFHSCLDGMEKFVHFHLNQTTKLDYHKFNNNNNKKTTTKKSKNTRRTWRRRFRFASGTNERTKSWEWRIWIIFQYFLISHHSGIVQRPRTAMDQIILALEYLLVFSLLFALGDFLKMRFEYLHFCYLLFLSPWKGPKSFKYWCRMFHWKLLFPSSFSSFGFGGINTHSKKKWLLNSISNLDSFFPLTTNHGEKFL